MTWPFVDDVLCHLSYHGQSMTHTCTQEHPVTLFLTMSHEIWYRSDEDPCMSCHTSNYALLVCILTLYLLSVLGLMLCDWGCSEALGKGLTGTNNCNNKNYRFCELHKRYKEEETCRVRGLICEAPCSML